MELARCAWPATQSISVANTKGPGLAASAHPAARPWFPTPPFLPCTRAQAPPTTAWTAGPSTRAPAGWATSTRTWARGGTWPPSPTPPPSLPAPAGEGAPRGVGAQGAVGCGGGGQRCCVAVGGMAHGYARPLAQRLLPQPSPSQPLPPPQAVLRGAVRPARLGGRRLRQQLRPLARVQAPGRHRRGPHRRQLWVLLGGRRCGGGVAWRGLSAMAGAGMARAASARAAVRLRGPCTHLTRRPSRPPSPLCPSKGPCIYPGNAYSNKRW